MICWRVSSNFLMQKGFIYMKTLKKQVTTSNRLRPTKESSQVVETVSVRKKLSAKVMSEYLNPNEFTPPVQTDHIQFVDATWDKMQSALEKSLQLNPTLGKLLAE